MKCLGRVLIDQGNGYAQLKYLDPAINYLGTVSMSESRNIQQSLPLVFVTWARDHIKRIRS